MNNEESGIQRKVGKVKVRIIAKKRELLRQSLRGRAETDSKRHSLAGALTMGYGSTAETASTGAGNTARAEEGNWRLYRLREVRNLVVLWKQICVAYEVQRQQQRALRFLSACKYTFSKIQHQAF
jgi:hypothetical protein